MYFSMIHKGHSIALDESILSVRLMNKLEVHGYQ